MTEGRVLVVDDDSKVRDSFSSFLSSPLDFIPYRSQFMWS